MKKAVKEFAVAAPWGEIAAISWGDSSKPQLLLVHGYMDTAATFILLMDLLPDNYFYVAFDWPGLGKSSNFPPGPQLTHAHLVEPMRLLVKHMGWDHFMCLTHSVGFVVATMYNTVYPGRITRMISVDPAPGLTLYYYSEHNVPELLTRGYFVKNYNIYDSFYKEQPAVPYKKLINLVAMARGISTQQAKVVVSRSLAPAGDGLVRFTWDPRMKSIAPVIMPGETHLAVFTTNVPPTLFLVSSVQSHKGKLYGDYSLKHMEKIENEIPDCTVITVEGGHDVHITNPERLSPHIVEFLNRDVDLKAKL